jgi:tetratricopeptide (TPR) repeat protein
VKLDPFKRRERSWTWSPSLKFSNWIERRCQLEHIRALLLLGTGQYTEARRILEKILAGDPDENNRELLWVSILQISCEHGGHDEALMLFPELVKPILPQGANQYSDQAAGDPSKSSSLNDEPEPTERLEIGEHALRIVRAARLEVAEELLLRKNLRWVRLEDFWILQCGSITETAWGLVHRRRQ